MATIREDERNLPGMFDVGTSGQRSVFGRKVIDPVKGYFSDAAAAARGADFEQLRSARAPQQPASTPLVASARPPAASIPNGVAQQMPSVPSTGIPQMSAGRALSREAFGPAIQNQGQTAGDQLAGMGYATRSVQGAPGVSRIDGRGRTIYTDDQANTAEWIQGGMRPGVSSISGPSAQEMSDRADRMRSLREESTALRDGLAFSAGGALSRQKTQDEIERDMITGQSRTGQRVAAELMGNRQRAMTDQRRMDIDQQRADTDREATGLAAQATRADLAERDRINKLRDRYEAEQDPGKREQIGRALLLMQGKEPSEQNGRWMLADMETGAQDQFGNPLTRKVPVNPVTGQVFKPGGGQGAAQVPAVAVQALRSNPQMAQQFDQKYGQGAAARYLSG